MSEPDWADEEARRLFAKSRFDIASALRAAHVRGLREAAEMAEGPALEHSPETGEVRIRGVAGANWTVPQPMSGYRGSEYGTGRYDAANAIRNRADELEKQ